MGNSSRFNPYEGLEVIATTKSYGYPRRAGLCFNPYEGLEVIATACT